MRRGPLLAAMLLPGLAGHDPRVRVDPTLPPWSAVVRVQIPGVSRCTGFAVAPRLIATAAHCLYGRALGHMVPARSIHVLSGYAAGQFTRHALALSYRLGEGYVGSAAETISGADLAVLSLAQPVTSATLPLTEARAGQAAVLGGYSQDRAEALLADPGCKVLDTQVLEARPEPRLLRHSCAGTRGTSGGPLLVLGADGVWRAAGVQVAARDGAAGGLAVPALTLQHLLGPP